MNGNNVIEVLNQSKQIIDKVKKFSKPFFFNLILTDLLNIVDQTMMTILNIEMIKK